MRQELEVLNSRFMVPLGNHYLEDRIYMIISIPQFMLLEPRQPQPYKYL